MLKALLKYFGPWLLSQLSEVLDPDAAERAKALALKVADIDKRETEAAELQKQSDVAYAKSQQQYQESIERRDALSKQRAGIEQEIAAEGQALKDSQIKLKTIQDEAQKAKDAIDARSADDAILGGVPKPTV